MFIHYKPSGFNDTTNGQDTYSFDTNILASVFLLFKHDHTGENDDTFSNLCNV